MQEKKKSVEEKLLRSIRKFGDSTGTKSKKLKTLGKIQKKEGKK